MTLERTTVHVGDDSGRIAMLEVRTAGSDSAPATLKRFIYSNHLQSATLELDESGNIISYEEYHPYGTTAYQAMNSDIGAVAKRYRFTGKERVEESGLSYHGARYYIPWLCRWAAVDPLESKYAGMSPYNYCFNNPVMHTDSSGTEPQKVTMLNAVTVTAKAPESLRMKRMMEAAKNAAMAGVAGAGNALVQSAKNQHAFLRGLVKGIIAVVVVVAVIAAVAATGGVGAAVIAPMLTEIASVGGAAMTSKAILDVTTGKDTFTGQKLSEEQRYETGGELVGGTVAGVTIGAVAASGSGSSSSKSGGYLTNSTGKVTFDNTTSTGNTTFTETTSSASSSNDSSPYYEEPSETPLSEGNSKPYEPYQSTIIESNSRGNFEIDAENTEFKVEIHADAEISNDGKTLTLKNIVMGGVNKETGVEMAGNEFGLRNIFQLIRDNAQWFNSKGYENVNVNYTRAGYSSSANSNVPKSFNVDINRYLE